MSAPRGLDEVRRELQRLGYLSHRLERFLLQDALKPDRPGRTLVSLAIKIGLLAGCALALVNAFALAAANGLLASASADLPLLFLHLWPPLAVASGLGFLAVAGVFLAILARWPRRRLAPLRGAAAVTVAALVVGLGLSRGWELVLGLPRWQRVVVALALPLLAAALARLTADGLLAFEVRLARWAPTERSIRRRTVAVGLAATLVLLGALALFAPAAKSEPAPGSLPMSPGERVVLLGIDGVLPDELDYLLAHGDLPRLAELVKSGGVVAGYRRSRGEPPAAFWTTVATGLDPAAHGVVSLDTYRPAGLRTPLARSGPWRAYWEWVERPLGLAEYRPLMAHGRRAQTVWELGARGGAPVAALGWWATYPAEPIPGIVLAHDAYHLLAAGAPGAVAPESRREEMLERVRATEAGPFAEAVASALPPAAAQRALDRALLPDRFLRAVARAEAARAPKVLALYQPGGDLLAEGWTAGELPLEYLLRLQLVEIDTLVADLIEGAGTLVAVFDPGRRGGNEGRAVVWRGACSAAGRPEVDPRALAAGLLRAAGLPQSRQLPAPPDFCVWPPPPATVPTYGARDFAAAPADGGAEYLENLRALGYL